MYLLLQSHQNSLILLKIPCVSHSHLSSLPLKQLRIMIFLVVHKFASLKMSSNWNNIVMVAFLEYIASFTKEYAFKVPVCFFMAWSLSLSKDILFIHLKGGGGKGRWREKLKQTWH